MKHPIIKYLRKMLRVLYENIYAVVMAIPLVLYYFISVKIYDYKHRKKGTPSVGLFVVFGLTILILASWVFHWIVN